MEREKKGEKVYIKERKIGRERVTTYSQTHYGYITWITIFFPFFYSFTVTFTIYRYGFTLNMVSRLVIKKL